MAAKQTEFSKIDTQTRERRVVRGTLWAGTFFFLGFTSVITGFALTIIHAVIPNNLSLSSVGTFFIFVSIPLLMIGSYLLDLSDK